MSWSEEDFFPAFNDAGMLAVAYRNGFPDPVTVGFLRPDALLLDEMVKVTQYQIEYETAEMPDLEDGEMITIGADIYVVSGPPENKKGSRYSIAEVVKS